jgi:mono/diheme cytochrome c family protein
MRLPHLPTLLAAVVLVLAASACARSTPAPAAAPTAAGPTAGQLSDQGKQVFASHCAKCHGDQGQGVTAPANIGPNATLQKYKTAKGLYDYVSTLMPNDAPGSLSQQEYLQVVSYLLVQNNFVSPQAPINPNTLDSISLTK